MIRELGVQIASMHFKERAREKLGDERLQRNLQKIKSKFVGKRRSAITELDDFEGTRDAARAIRQRALDDLDVWLELFEAVPDLDVAYVPIGLGSGACAAIAARSATESPGGGTELRECSRIVYCACAGRAMALTSSSGCMAPTCRKPWLSSVFNSG